jgi:hypothetical protein
VEGQIVTVSYYAAGDARVGHSCRKLGCLRRWCGRFGIRAFLKKNRTGDLLSPVKVSKRPQTDRSPSDLGQRLSPFAFSRLHRIVIVGIVLSCQQWTRCMGRMGQGDGPLGASSQSSVPGIERRGEAQVGAVSLVKRDDRGTGSTLPG